MSTSPDPAAGDPASPDTRPLSPREYLYSLEHHGIKLGLDNINHLLDAAGRPERNYPTVHVAGTNGKGSVVAMLDAIFRAAGYRTGRFTSPHLLELNERFLLNAEPVADDELDAELAYFRAIAEAMPYSPTFFEVVTAVAFRWFAKKRVEVGLIEVGMGGRFDSTNVVVPEACAITNIDKEHTRYLGDTLAKIAFEKAGIIKPGVPVVVSETNSEPKDVILARAAELGSPVRLAGRDFTFSVTGPAYAHQFSFAGEKLHFGPTALSLPGAYQGENAATAIATVEALMPAFPRLDQAAVREGLGAARWPCRMERVLDNPPVIIDVAHNAAGARKLAEEIQQAVVVVAVSSDKNAPAMLQTLAPGAHTLILTRFTGSRSLPVDELVRAAGEIPHQRAENLREAIELGLSLASEERPLVITGSIFAAGEARRILMETVGAAPLEF